MTDVPRLEAEVLTSHVLGISRTMLLAHPERQLTTGELVRCTELVHRRAAADYPLPYLTGRTEFYGLEFKVTPDVLIPRPETELLVDLAITRQPATIVDVGTGSGCIAISLAVHLPDAFMYAIELSTAALIVALENATHHHVSDRIRFMAGDLLMPRPSPVDLIVSNPPYVSADEWASLPPSVRDHEPQLALDGGPDGLVAIRQLLAEAPAVLRPGGVLLMEIGASQGEAALELASAYFPQAEARIFTDLSGHDRVLEVQT
ncbi:MAG: peptide chain release factor N(5)-glutamine methyltransferase [Anaerolineales bacterium]|nr:peptide chain release factor N(5)-glutamine methyltransferase [Anaerolineales bacterium]